VILFTSDIGQLAYLDGAKTGIDVNLSVTDRLEGGHCHSNVLEVLDGSRQLRQHFVHERVDFREQRLVANVHVTTDEVTPRLHLDAQALFQLSWSETAATRIIIIIIIIIIQNL